MFIDTHCHFWKIDRGDYLWLKTDNETLYKDYLPEHIQSYSKKNVVRECIAVQAAATIEETKLLLEFADSHEQVLGLVHSHPLSPKEAPSRYQKLRQIPYFIGVHYTLNSFDTDK